MKFIYQAKNQQGNTEKGTIDALNKQGAIDTLRNNNLIIISLKSSRDIALFSKNLSFLDRVKNKDIVIFTRQLAVLVQAHVPLVQSLKTLSKQTKSNTFQEKIFDLVKKVEAGEPLSGAMMGHKKLFSNFYVNIVKTGEVSGSLHKSLIYLADHLEKDHDLRHKIKSALSYPIFVVIAFIGVAVAMMVFVIPKLTAILTESGTELPIQTKALIGVSSSLINYYWAWILVLASLIGFIIYFIRTPKGKKQFDVIKLKMPIFGSLFKKIYISRFTENLSTLVTAGIPIIKSLEITAEVVGNSVYKKIFLQASKKVSTGEQIAVTFKKHPNTIPFMVAQMIEIGENTGKLDSVLDNIADFYTREVNNAVSGITQLIEPILMVAMGIGVAILVSAILMPIYQISSGAGM